MNSLPTFREGHGIKEIVTAIVTERLDIPGTDFLGWNVKLSDTSGDTVHINQGHYRTPSLHLGHIVWSEAFESHTPPILSEGDDIVVEYGPGEILIWCPAGELTDAYIQLDTETAEERELEAHADTPELRIIDDDEREEESPRVQWSGWLRNQLYTHSGNLPGEMGDYIIQRHDGIGNWEEVPFLEQGRLFGQLIKTPCAKKRVKA